MKKNFFIIIDTETSINDNVVDFSAVVCDRHGRVVKSCAVLIDSTFKNETLFYKEGTAFSATNLNTRYKKYNEFLKSGNRQLASIRAINIWLNKALEVYKPYLTAYNLQFDVRMCANTGIDLGIFSDKFCLWAELYKLMLANKRYLKFCLDNGFFNNPTPRGNLSIKVNAESVSSYVLGSILTEPHTAYEDIVYHEIPILKYLLGKRSVKNILTNPNGKPDWKQAQARDLYKPK